MPQVNGNCLKIGASSCLFLPTHHGAKECALTCQMSYVERNFHSACAFSSCPFSRYYYFYLSDGNLGAQKNIKSLAQRYTQLRGSISEPQSLTVEQLAPRHGVPPPGRAGGGSGKLC